eukprot:2572783-Pleurochrysis_carterae.AAC.1
MASRTGRVQRSSVRSNFQVNGLTRLETIWSVHRLTRIVRPCLGLGRRSFFRRCLVRRYKRARGFVVFLSRARAFG